MMTSDIKKRVSNLKELRAEKLRLQSQIDYTKEMLAINLSFKSLKSTALNSLPVSVNAMISSGLTNSLLRKNKGIKGAMLGFLVPLVVPHISRLVMKMINKNK